MSKVNRVPLDLLQGVGKTVHAQVNRELGGPPAPSPGLLALVEIRRADMEAR